MTAIADLIRAVEAGEILAGKDFCIAGRVRVKWTAHDEMDAYRAYHGSLDAALALHEALLPGWEWQRQGFVMTVTTDHTGWGNGKYASARDDTNPARALLLAILRALEAQETNDA